MQYAHGAYARTLGLALTMLCVAAAAGPAALAEAALITEFMAINDSTIADDDGTFSDWLEIHNDAPTSLDLDGYYVTDDDQNLTKWRFPSVVIPAGGYLLVWASDKDRAPPGGPVHTNFKLSSGGEFLALVQPDGLTIEHAYAPAFPTQAPDISYGLASDLTTERCFHAPTPGAANDESTPCGFIEPLAFSAERGFYDAPFLLEVGTPTPGVTIRYTTDASDPSESHGTIYTAPIPIGTTTTVRAIGYATGLQPMASVTHTYLFLDDVLAQSQAGIPPGYPDKWTAGTGADYDMDQRVVTDPAYASEIRDDLRSIPTMSIVTDVPNLFDPQTGIYMHVSSKGVNWERPVSVEYFDRADGRQFQINCGMRIQGGQSRENSLHKHNLRLLFKGIYGPTKLDFPLFSDSPVESFDTLVLTAGHGNSWHGGYERALHMRDTWAKDTQRAMGQVASHATYVHLYLNGMYWGLYRPTERPSGPFAASYLGGAREDYDVINSGKIVDGDKIAWDTMQNLANQPLDVVSNYNALLQYLDADNLIDYMIVNMYGSNNDWDFHNWYAARKREPGAGFRFFSWDAENILQNASGNRTSVKFFDAPSGVYDDLRRENVEFQVAFGDHAHRHLFDGGALTPERATARLLVRADEIRGAVVAESARWGDNRGRSTPFTRDVEWIRELNWQRHVFFPRRREIFLDQLRSKGLYPSVVAPTLARHGGTFDPGSTLEISAPAGTIYLTTDGTDPRLFGGAINPSAQAYAGPVALADTVHVAARAIQAGAWSALVAADFVQDTPIRISEIMFHAAAGSEHDFLELANVGNAPVDLGGFAFTDGIDFVFPPLPLASGAHALVVSDLAAFEAHYGPGLPIAGQYTGELSNGGERVTLRDAAGNAFIDFSYDDLWHPAADGSGRSLVARDELQDASLYATAAGWRPSGLLSGSPGFLEPSLCANGIDDDGDGAVDGADPGCAGAAQDDESPACDDGIDNDADGLIDGADSACASPSDQSEEPPAVDPFVCYSARANAAADRFESVDVVLDDAIEAGAQYTVRKTKTLCLPSSLDGATVGDEQIHLQAFQIAAVSGQPAPPNTQFLVDGNFGPMYLDTGKPDLLLVPAAMSETGPVLPPVASSHEVDSYKCYRMRLTKARPKYFPSGAEAGASNDFESKQFRIKAPRYFCNPVSIDGEAIKNPEGHLSCFPARRNKYSSSHVPRAALHTAMRFGDDLLDTRREDSVCIPAKIRTLP